MNDENELQPAFLAEKAKELHQWQHPYLHENYGISLKKIEQLHIADKIGLPVPAHFFEWKATYTFDQVKAVIILIDQFIIFLTIPDLISL